MDNSKSRAFASLFGILVCAPISAQITQRVSLSSGGAQGDGGSGSFGSSISSDGRYVAFESRATNLVAGDTNGWEDIFVRDRQSGTTVWVSLSTFDDPGNDSSFFPSISSDGRYVAFWSLATNLVPGDANGSGDIFVRDRQTGMTERVSVDSSGTEQGGSCNYFSAISEDGRFVVFQCDAANLVPGDTNGRDDIFVRDRQQGTTERVSVDSSGTEGDLGSFGASISADGRYVAFWSQATNLVAGDANGFVDSFVHDRQGGTTEIVSVDSGGVQGNHHTFSTVISADGRWVGFESYASNLVGGDTNGFRDIFVRDRQNSTTERVSVDSSAAQADGESYNPSISADGRYVSCCSAATNLVSGDSNGFDDIFLRDRQAGTTERVNVHSDGTEANDSGFGPSMSGDGRYMSYTSFATNLVSGDTNNWGDVFVRDRDATSFTSLCDPGVSGVQSCPCSNPPAGSGRGCNNSSGTGGASLTATGIAYLSMDSLVFTTSGQRPTALSILLQGTTSPPAGIIYGQGIRCVGGSLKRLFNKAAVGGSITAPNFGAGDPTVSARSAARGDVIGAGQSRWYLVFYRDPTVLGGCPATSTFNATQTGLVAWSL